MRYLINQLGINNEAMINMKIKPLMEISKALFNRNILKLLLLIPVLLSSYVNSYAAPASTELFEYYSPDTLILSKEQKTRIMNYVRHSFLQAAGYKENNQDYKSIKDLPNAPIHLSFRKSGGFFTEGISFEDRLDRTITSAIKRAITFRKFRSREKGADAFPKKLAKQLGIEITLFYDQQPINDRTITVLKSQIQLGIHGIGIATKKSSNDHKNKQWNTLFSNSKPIIHNYSHKKLFQALSESLGLLKDGYRKATNKLYYYKTLHLVQTSPFKECRELLRCDRIIDISEVTFERIISFRNEMGNWLKRNVREDGRMEYKYKPSRGSYSSSNNMIRQWMATYALAELYRVSGNKSYAETWKKNVDYNLTHFYRESDGGGYIIYNNKAKLGAISIALMSLINSPDPDSYKGEINKLMKLIIHLWEDDGSFRTFYIPEDRNDNQSFYPGEALLAISMMIERNNDKKLIHKMKQSMQFYMDYYRSINRNTAFIPWHTMAYWRMYQITEDKEYLNAIFELNDWLINIQNLGDDKIPDLKGRFYLPQFSFYGPPHASSTAIYIEGLAYAYDLAKKSGDEDRAQAYLESIRWGIRGLIQLQFRPENAFYLSKKNRVLGGLRTRVTDNQMRIDNAQHAIMGMIAVERFLSREDIISSAPKAKEFRRKALERFVNSPSDIAVIQKPKK